MELAKGIKERRSIRKFKNKPVSEETLAKVVELASYAPSWKNSQTVRYLAIGDEELKKKLGQDCIMGFAYNQKTIMSAPLLVLLTTIESRSGYERDGSYATSKETHWESFDAGAAAQTFCLAAYEKGLGTVIMGIFDEEKVRDAVNLPENQKVSAMIAIGYPDETPVIPKRKAVEELLTIKL